MRIILSLVFFVFAFGVVAQKEYIRLEVSPQTVGVGNEIVITIKSNISGEFDLDLPSEFVSGYDLIEERRHEMDYKTGAVREIYFIAKNGSFSKNGTYIIGPAYVKTNQKVIKSNTVKVQVVDDPGNFNQQPSQSMNKDLNARIEINKTTIYEGEPVVLSAGIYTKFKPHNAGFRYKPYLIDGSIDNISLDGMTNPILKEIQQKGQKYYHFKYNKQLIFPVGIGSIQIQPFTIVLSDGYTYHNASSNHANIKVKALPGNVPSDFIGAVGSFSLKSSIDKNSVKEGEIVKLTLIVSGSGNLQNIEVPLINPGKNFIIYGDPTILEDYIYTEKGAEGAMTFVYNLQAVKDGSASVLATISYFDPNTEKYVSLENPQFELDIINVPGYDFNKADTTAQAVNPNQRKASPFKIRPELIEETNYSRSNSTWLLFGALPLLSLMFALIIRKIRANKGKSRSKAKIRSSLVNNEFAQAEELNQQGLTKEAYAALQKALIKILSWSVFKEEKTASRSALIDALKQSNIRPETIQALENLLEKCESIRFSMLEIESDFEKDLRSAREIEKEIRKKL